MILYLPGFQKYIQLVIKNNINKDVPGHGAPNDFAHLLGLFVIPHYPGYHLIVERVAVEVRYQEHSKT